ncbi:MAG: RidA family protein [Solirubrobacterales bacterium]
MAKRAIETDSAPLPEGGYSQAIVAGGLLFASGQAALDPQSGELRGSTVEEQTALTIDNLESVLAAAGATLGDVVKATAHLHDIGTFDEFDATYRRRMPAPLPARTTVASGLGPGILVEIDVIAALPDQA